MSDRDPEPWETNAQGPFLTVEGARGAVEVWALGADRFSVRAPGHEQVVAGYDAAREMAHALAERSD
jgi:hypothetical protein